MMRSALLLLCMAACGGDDGGGAPDAAPVVPLAVARVDDLGIVPLPGAAVGRDGGEGGLLGGKLLWTFGDTFLSAQNPIDHSSVLSATGGWASPASPLEVTQPVDSGGFPAQLVPYTDAEIAANTADALNGWALWPGQLIDTGDAEGLLLFQRIKRTNGSGFDSVGVGTARIAVDATVATRAPADLFAPPEPLFIPDFAHDGFVYALQCGTVGFLNIGCKVGRAPLASAETRAAYEFYDGTAWQSDIARAAVVIDRGGTPSISYNAHLGRFLSVTCETLSSTILLRTAPAIEGPWDRGIELTASADGASGVYAPTDATNYNYICHEQTALVSADGAQIEISYSRPTTAFRGDVRLARITLE